MRTRNACSSLSRAPCTRSAIRPDFEVNRGHYFGTDLSDPDKTALIAFLKTL